MHDLIIPATTLSPGIAIGKAVLLGPGTDVPEKKGLTLSERVREKELLAAALDLSVRELKLLAERIGSELGRDKAEIFESHADILEDDDFRHFFYTLIDEEGYSATFAVKTGAEKHAAEMEALDDEYFRNRADDFRDIGSRVIAQINLLASGVSAPLAVSGIAASPGEGSDAASLRFPRNPSIIVSRSLSPGQTVQFYLPNVQGFVVCSGGSNSHAAILARSLSIPAVLVSEGNLEAIAEGMHLIINLERDTLIMEPGEDARRKAEGVRLKETARAERLSLFKDKPGATRCGKRIQLYANGGSMKDLSAIIGANSEGIGLFRTEFLFMEQSAFPDEASQTAFYRRILDVMESKPVVFRLLDIGGDKPLPYAPHPHESNPFLGWRGIRFLLDNPDILKTQLRSLLLASEASGKTVRIMVPMVARTGEMRAVKDMLEAEQKKVGGKAVLGMMVETPAAALTVASYAGLISFISIGSNDLTQYALAADRENGHLGTLYSEFSPAVLFLMQKACADAHAAGMEAGICGEFAGRREGVLLLAAMGFDELSMSSSSIAPAKEALSLVDFTEIQYLLAEALSAFDAESVQETVRKFLELRENRL